MRPGACVRLFDMALAVVVPAEKFEVVEIGGSAAGPVPFVMGLTPGGGFFAAGGLAVAIAGDQCPELGVARDAGGAAQVEHFRMCRA
jgi:hypothetical protein